MNLQDVELRQADLQKQLAAQEELVRQGEIAKVNAHMIRGALQDVAYWREQLAQAAAAAGQDGEDVTLTIPGSELLARNGAASPR
jgi:argininosuccinate lyase